MNMFWLNRSNLNVSDIISTLAPMLYLFVEKQIHIEAGKQQKWKAVVLTWILTPLHVYMQDETLAGTPKMWFNINSPNTCYIRHSLRCHFQSHHLTSVVEVFWVDALQPQGFCLTQTCGSLTQSKQPVIISLMGSVCFWASLPLTDVTDSMPKKLWQQSHTSCPVRQIDWAQCHTLSSTSNTA